MKRFIIPATIAAVLGIAGTVTAILRHRSAIK